MQKFNIIKFTDFIKKLSFHGLKIVPKYISNKNSSRTTNLFT